MKTKKMNVNNWKAVPVETELLQSKDFTDFGGIEELSSYNIIKADGEITAVNKRRKKHSKEAAKKSMHVCEENPKPEKKKSTKEIDMSAWCNCFVPNKILMALKDLNFISPTPIQSLCIPSATRDRLDILGAAETGSGKTLAFGIPIVSSILSIKENLEAADSALYSVIIAPTRELAIQIKKEISSISKYSNIKIATIVGGMALEKQRRILKKFPEIVVGTPGRLWELIEEGEPHLIKIKDIKHLVIDEADRMLEKGHFAELEKILNLVNSAKSKRQNFVFSATLTFVHDAPKRLMFKKAPQKLNVKIEHLIESIGMRQPKVIDITRKAGVVETLTESQIMCSIEQKDTYLYYFLYLHPGKNIIFVNSKDCLRRLRTILQLLDLNPLILHAAMHQKQRIKNLEKFSSSQSSVLLTTDVAARGLDIKNIDHVIHYQVPRTTETYIHRSGRTARAQNEGLSLMLIEPQEGPFYKRICKNLNKDKPLSTFPINHKIFKILQERVILVCAIDKLEHRIKRLSAQNRWFLNVAKEVDVDIEDENLLNDIGNEEENAAKCREVKTMKKRLKSLLAKPVVSKMIASSYPTKNGKLINPRPTSSQKAISLVKKRKRNVYV